MQNLYCRFSWRTVNLIPLNLVQDNSKSNSAILIKLSGLILETFVSEWYLNDCISFSVSKIATVFFEIDRKSFISMAFQTFIIAPV